MMRIGIVGRHGGLLQGALETARALRLDALGATQDDQVMEWLRAGNVDVLIIGGGVDRAARATFSTHAETRGIRIIEVWGPQQLPAVLRELAAAPDDR